MSMNEFLAQYYGTGSNAEVQSEKLASAEEAQIELFAKLAADNGIDLEKLSEEQVDELYEATFKEAAEDEDDKKAPPFAKKEDKGDEDEKDEKKAQVEAEFAEKKASQDKIAEADFLGRVMAHSYVNEMRKIAESAGEGSDKEAGVGEHASNAWNKAKRTAGTAALGASLVGQKAKYEGGRAAKAVGKHVKSHRGKYEAGAAVGVAGGGVAAGRASKKEKQASALDELALDRAVDMVADFNKQAGEEKFDLEQAGARLDAVFTLGLGESTKIASAADADQAVEVRALEYLEAAGYPVTWAE